MGPTCHNAKSSLFPFVPSSASLSLSYFSPLCRRLAGGEEVAGARRETATTGGGDGGRGEGRASPRLGVGKAREAAGGGRRGCCFDTGWLLPRHQLVASSPATKWPGRGGGRSPRRRTRQANAWMSMEDGDEEYDVLRTGLRRRPPASSRVGAAAAPAPPAAAPASPPAASPFSSIAAAAQLLPAVACRGTRSARRRPRFTNGRLFLLKRWRRRAASFRAIACPAPAPPAAAARLSLLKRRRRHAASSRPVACHGSRSARHQPPLPSQAPAPPRGHLPQRLLRPPLPLLRRRPPLPSQASPPPPSPLPRRPHRHRHLPGLSDGSTPGLRPRGAATSSLLPCRRPRCRRSWRRPPTQHRPPLPCSPTDLLPTRQPPCSRRKVR